MKPPPRARSNQPPKKTTGPNDPAPKLASTSESMPHPMTNTGNSTKLAKPGPPFAKARPAKS